MVFENWGILSLMAFKTFRLRILALLEKRLDIKLVAQAKNTGWKGCGFVLPQLLSDDHLGFVQNEYNGVVMKAVLPTSSFSMAKCRWFSYCFCGAKRSFRAPLSIQIRIQKTLPCIPIN
jgi:hypothetical protein